ncbi:MAG: hypothetical protein M1343_08475 [Chloroflexi bacterium]|nr:hypothetical protein [Chloroflexota bacterium]
MTEANTDDPLIQVFGGVMIGSARVMGIDVKMRTLTSSEVQDILAQCQSIQDTPLRLHKEMSLTLAYSLLEVAGNALPELIGERVTLIGSWRQTIIDKLATAYGELTQKERLLIDELKN